MSRGESGTLRQLGERGLIERLKRRFGSGPGVRVGIGDDAAVLAAPPGHDLLFASDMLVEGVHFRRTDATPAGVGWKALACNVSDIAAMGGMPRWAVVSLGGPPQTTRRWLDGIAQGLARCAKHFHMAVVGGDTVRAPQLVIDVAILGTVARGRAILRSGARVGDLLFVTGRLGGSYRSGRHLRFIPRAREAQELLRRVPIHAMMDLSDGLAQDLWQLSRASRAGLQVDAARVPVARAAHTLRHALADGEDFELLFAVGPRDARHVPKRLGICPVTRIGEVVSRTVGVTLRLPGGRFTPLPPSGFSHF